MYIPQYFKENRKEVLIDLMLNIHCAVPKWNYAVVYAKGHAQVLDDEKILRGALAKLTRAGESKQPAYSPQYFPPIRKSTLQVIRIDLYH